MFTPLTKALGIAFPRTKFHWVRRLGALLKPAISRFLGGRLRKRGGAPRNHGSPACAFIRNCAQGSLSVASTLELASEHARRRSCMPSSSEMLRCNKEILLGRAADRRGNFRLPSSSNPECKL